MVGCPVTSVAVPHTWYVLGAASEPGGGVGIVELVHVPDPGCPGAGGLLLTQLLPPKVQVTGIWPNTAHPFGAKTVSVATSGALAKPEVGETLAPGLGVAASATFAPYATMAAPARNVVAIARFTGQS